MTKHWKLISLPCLYWAAQIVLGTAVCLGILDSLFYVSPQMTLFENPWNVLICIILLSIPAAVVLPVLYYLER